MSSARRGATLSALRSQRPGEHAARLTDRGQHHGATERDERLIARRRVTEERRREPRADHRASDETGEREHTDHEPATKPSSREKEDHADGDQVGSGHLSSFAPS